MILWPLPEGTSTTLTTCGELLPAFVVSRLKDLADEREWDDDRAMTFYEVQGHLKGQKEKTYLSPVNFWTGSDDNCNREIHIGGSLCWVNPTDDALFFEPIDPALFADHPNDPNVWWCIHHEGGIKVARIEIVERAPYDFPEEL